jgi:drug/metabolite transporter (DMT)-like permease
VGVWALLLIVILLSQHRARGQRTQRTRLAGAAGGIAVAFIASKVVGMMALLLQNYAIKSGSVTVVNALQGTQYLFVLILAMAVSAFAPRFFREEFSRVALMQKIIGIGCVTLGLIVLLVN